MDRLTVFIALDTPAEVRREIADLRDGLKPYATGVRWEGEEKYHCTLQFLGSVERARLESIAERVSAAASGIPPLALGYSGIGFFPEGKTPRVIWVGVTCQGSGLLRLREGIASGLAAIGFPSEDRPFQGHVTLGRAVPGGSLRSLIGIVETRTFEHTPVPVPAVEIMQSTPGPRGSVYTALRVVPLSGKARGNPPG